MSGKVGCGPVLTLRNPGCCRGLSGKKRGCGQAPVAQPFMLLHSCSQLALLIRYPVASHGLCSFESCAAEQAGVYGRQHDVVAMRSLCAGVLWSTSRFSIAEDTDFGDHFVRAVWALPNPPLHSLLRSTLLAAPDAEGRVMQ